MHFTISLFITLDILFSHFHTFPRRIQFPIIFFSLLRIFWISHADTILHEKSSDILLWGSDAHRYGIIFVEISRVKESKCVHDEYSALRHFRRGMRRGKNEA